MQNRRLSGRGPTVALTDNGRFGAKTEGRISTSCYRRAPKAANSISQFAARRHFDDGVTAIQARSMRELFRELIDGADVEPEYNV
jgi:hypothetical protein